MLILSWWFFARFKPQVWTCWPTLNTPDTQAILIELSIILSFLRVLWNFVAHKEEIIFSYFIMSEMRKTRDSTNQQHITVLCMRSLGLSWYLFLTVFLFHLLSEKEAVLHEMHSVFPTGHISFLFFPFVNFFLFLQGDWSFFSSLGVLEKQVPQGLFRVAMSLHAQWHVLFWSTLKHKVTCEHEQDNSCSETIS